MTDTKLESPVQRERRSDFDECQVATLRRLAAEERGAHLRELVQRLPDSTWSTSQPRRGRVLYVLGAHAIPAPTVCPFSCGHRSRCQPVVSRLDARRRTHQQSRPDCKVSAGACTTRNGLLLLCVPRGTARRVRAPFQDNRILPLL